MSAGDGSKGPRLYGWAWITIEPERDAPGQWWLLIRRNNATGELAYHRCWAPPRAPARPRPRRRPPLDDRRVLPKPPRLSPVSTNIKVCRWTSWQRWTILAMLAYAYLAIVAATE